MFANCVKNCEGLYFPHKTNSLAVGKRKFNALGSLAFFSPLFAIEVCSRWADANFIDFKK